MRLWNVRGAERARIIEVQSQMNAAPHVSKIAAKLQISRRRIDRVAS